MTITAALEQSQSGLVHRVNDAIREHDLNLRARQNYMHWITRFVLYHDCQDPESLGPEHCQQFLDYLQDGMSVSRAKLNQAQQALAFFYRDVLGKHNLPETAAA